MIVKVRKRDGELVPFDQCKIKDAITKAFIEVNGYFSAPDGRAVDGIVTDVTNHFMHADVVGVEDIQDEVEKRLMNRRRYNEARAYMNYRYLHQIAREQYGELMSAVEEKLTASNVQNQNANVDEESFGGRLGEALSVVSKRFALERCMSKMARRNHENNEIYIHDLDSYAIGSHNCLSIPFDDLLRNGFNTRQTDVRPAQSVNTAFQLVAVIFQLQSLQQFGGVSATHLDWTMVPYVRKSFAKHFLDGVKWLLDDNIWYDKEELSNSSIDASIYQEQPKAYRYAMDMTVKEVYQAVEAMMHNLNTLQSRSGN